MSSASLSERSHRRFFRNGLLKAIEGANFALKATSLHLAAALR